MKRSLFRSMHFWPFRGRPKILPWNIQGSGKPGAWGRVAGRIVRHPVPTLVAGVIFFGGLGLAVFGYTSAGFGGNTAPPAGSARWRCGKLRMKSSIGLRGRMNVRRPPLGLTSTTRSWSW